MIKSIKITNYLNESIVIDLASPEKSGLVVSNIDGLGPATAIINTSDLASADGSLFNSARLQNRNINIEFILFPNERDKSINTVEKVRYMVYKYLPIKRECTITVTTETRSAYVKGYVETNEPNIFSSMVKMNVSIICPDPWFYSIVAESTKFSGIINGFSFPFSSGIERIDGFAFGLISTDTFRNVFYSGDSETGLTMTIHAVGPATNIKIYNIGHRESMVFNDEMIEKLTGSKVIAGDDIVINTRRGNKSIYLMRDGLTYSIINAINRNATWFQLRKGDNTFAFTADDDGTSSPLNLMFTIDSNVIFEGM